jgi:tetratricopeptide (TPR) repeat protein
VGTVALQLHPREGPLLGTLALAQDDLGERELALKTLRQTTAINPNDLIAHFHAGRILAETGEFAKACAALEYVADHDKEAVRPREYLLFCYANLEQYDRCDSIAEEILKLDPDNTYLKDLFEEREKESGERESGEPDEPRQPPSR